MLDHSPPAPCGYDRIAMTFGATIAQRGHLALSHSPSAHNALIPLALFCIFASTPSKSTCLCVGGQESLLAPRAPLLLAAPCFAFHDEAKGRAEKGTTLTLRAVFPIAPFTLSHHSLAFALLFTASIYSDDVTLRFVHVDPCVECHEQPPRNVLSCAPIV